MAVTDHLQQLSGVGTDRGRKTVAVIAVAVLLPLLFGTTTANTVLVLAVFALGYNLLLGYGGELSFGHAAFYGLGGYGTILTIEYLVSNLYLAIVVSVVFTTIVSVIYGLISLRRRGIYFAMITLALAQMAYYIVFQWNSVTGGGDGTAVPLQSAAIGPIDPLAAGYQFYIFGLVLLGGTWLALRRVIRSPFGRALMAIRESEERARHVGYDVNKLLLLSFTMSGAIAGLAGAMHAVFAAFVTPNLLFWTMSGEVVLVTILGGIGTLTGPIVGAIIFGVLSRNLTQFTEHWPIIFGLIFVLVVMYAPEGVYGIYKEEETERELFNVQDLLERLGLR